MTQTFGASHKTYHSNGQPLASIRESELECATCRGSANGPYRYALIREDSMSVTLACPNCGDMQSRKTSDFRADEAVAAMLRAQQVEQAMRLLAKEAEAAAEKEEKKIAKRTKRAKSFRKKAARRKQKFRNLQ